MSINGYSENENAVIRIFDWMISTEPTWYSQRDGYMAANRFRAGMKSGIVLISLIYMLHPRLYSSQIAREMKFVVIAPGTYFSLLLTN